MDSITQAVLGVSVAEIGLGRKLGNKALIWGAALGTFPDLDIIPGKLYNEVDRLLFHRGASHSFLFSVISAFIFTWIICRIHQKKELNKKTVWWTVFWILATHIILDACTTWATSLFWPFSYRASLSSISIVDPLYTIPLILCPLIYIFINRDKPLRRKLNYLALGLSSLYLFSTFINKSIMTNEVKAELKTKNLSTDYVSVRPTIFNTVLWQINTRQGDHYLLGVRSWFDGNKETQYDKISMNKHLIKHWRGDTNLETLIGITEMQYVIEKIHEDVFLHDLRFGRIGFGEDAIFVFTYHLNSGKNKNLVNIKPARKRVSNMKQAMTDLWNRMFNLI